MSTKKTGPIRIAFVSPKGPLYHHRSGIFKKPLRPAPITFPTLAAYTPPELDVSFRVYDEGIEDVDPARVDADLVAITATTGSASRAYGMAASWRARKIPVVFGGPHATLVPDDAAPHVDTVVTGYAEETWPELLRDLVRGELRPRYDMAPDFAFDKLERLPFPRRDIMNRRGYRSLNTFEATRGCVHNCSFCVVPFAWGRKPYQKPIDHVVADIRQMGAKRLVFYDLNIIAERQYALDLFDALAPLRLQWYGLATALMGRDGQLMEAAARSGCRGLLVGFESVSASGLESHHKRFSDPKLYSDFVRDLQSEGIAVNGTFVFGGEADTPETFDAVADWVLTHRIELPRFSILTPFPGTDLFRELDAEGRIRSRDWSLYDGQRVVFEPRGMTADELLRGTERVWKQVYSVRSILERLRGKKRGAAVLLAVNAAYRFYAYRLNRFYTCNGGMM